MAQFNKDYIIIQKNNDGSSVNVENNKVAIYLNEVDDKAKVKFSHSSTKTIAYESFVSDISAALQIQIDSLTAASSGGFSNVNGLLSSDGVELNFTSDDNSITITPNSLNREINLQLDSGILQTINNVSTEVQNITSNIDTLNSDVSNLQTDVSNIISSYVTSVNSMDGGITIEGTVDEIAVTESGNNIQISLDSNFVQRVVDIEDFLSNGGGGGSTTSDVIAAMNVGAIDAGEVVPAGTTLQQFVEQLLLDTFYPTFTNPSANLTENIANTLESGTSTNVTLTMNFNRGSINGDLVGGIWSAGAFQDYRAGAATSYTINGTNTGTSNNLLVSGYTVVDGNNTWNASVTYGVGPQPTDSDGNPFNSPLVGGTLNSSVTISGRRRAFYGVDENSTVSPTTSAEIRALSGSLLNPANGSSFTINIPVGADQVIFAYPATLQDVSEVTYVEGLNADVKAIFTQTTFNVEGANNYNPISYKVYSYVPVEPFTSSSTYVVTI